MLLWLGTISHTSFNLLLPCDLPVTVVGSKAKAPRPAPVFPLLQLAIPLQKGAHHRHPQAPLCLFGTVKWSPGGACDRCIVATNPGLGTQPVPRPGLQKHVCAPAPKWVQPLAHAHGTHDSCSRCQRVGREKLLGKVTGFRLGTFVWLRAPCRLAG